jgi:putative MFS transporter
MWYVGFLAAVVLAYTLTAANVPWRWILATSAIPAIVTFLLRHAHPDRVPSIFYFCVVAPYFAIFTFAPLVFSTLHISDEKVSTIAANSVAALGALIGTLVIDKTGRRPMLIVCFWVMIITLTVIGGWSGAPGIIIVICFALFSFFNAGGGILCGIYPAEILPSQLRATGTGVAAAFSRLGAAGGTFLLPIGIAHLGIGPSVLIGAVIAAIGLCVTYLWAPETNGISLTQASSVEPPATPTAVPGTLTAAS